MRLLYIFISLVLWLASHVCLAETIVITGPTVIDKPTTYTNVILDLTQGSFVITNHATLDIENTVINGTVSLNNPFLINLVAGNLTLKNSTLTVTANTLLPSRNPTTYKAITVTDGTVTMTGNTLTVDTPFTVGLLATDYIATSDFIVSDNTITNFHGGIFLNQSSHARITHNHFSHVSLASILTDNGSHTILDRNVILSAPDDGVDVINSNNVMLSKNFIANSECYGVQIFSCQNLVMDHNHILGGITYAISIKPAAVPIGHMTPMPNQNIRLTNNYLAQNRYAITVMNVDGFTVQNNKFIQSFPDAVSRQFWTNNDILFRNVTNVTWNNNLYKEAFTQAMPGNNSLALKFVVFPLHGGVVF